jgi:hypothetical protein
LTSPPDFGVFILACQNWNNTLVSALFLFPKGMMNTAVANRPHRRARRGIMCVLDLGRNFFLDDYSFFCGARCSGGGETVVLSGAPSPWRRRAPLGSSSSSSPSSSYAEPDKELALAPVSDPVTGAQHAEEDDDDKTQPQRAASDPENNGHVQTNQAPPARRGRCC